MKVVIFCGGKGTRISEKSIDLPKPLLNIGDKPIIWHIMKIYSKFGYNDFILLTGFKGDIIKNYFANYSNYINDIEIVLQDNKINLLTKNNEEWNIKILNTGLETMTGGRLKFAEKYVDENFLLTYGDGVGNVDINKTIDFHLKKNKTITMTCAKEPTRFGIVKIKKDIVVNFTEKDQSSIEDINAGFFVVNKKIFNHKLHKNTIFEKDILRKLALKKEIAAFRHNGFWYGMDSARDNIFLNNLWKKNKAPWKIWKN